MEVCRARDARLWREVAIKVLFPATFLLNSFDEVRRRVPSR
jgi:hypothetical protein